MPVDVINKYFTISSIAQAETDLVAAAKCEDIRSRQVAVTQRYYANLEEHPKSDPETAAKLNA